MRDSAPEKANGRWRWRLLFTAAFALPWVAVFGSNSAIESWFPGQFKVNDWRNLSSLCFLLGGLAAAVLLLRLPKPLSIRLVGAFFAVLGSLLLALCFQLRSSCGGESVYIGERERTEVASCG